MLLEFSVQNFRSINEEQVLDLTPSSEKNHKASIFENDIAKALKVAGIYGANASGKSNLIRAFHAMEGIVRRSATKMSLGDPISQIVPFKLSENTIAEPSAFEIKVVIDDLTYVYGFSATQEQVMSEWLAVKKPKGPFTTWFERDFDPETEDYEWKFRGPLRKVKEQKLFKENTRTNGLALSRGAELNVEALKPLYIWFQERFWVLNLSIPLHGLTFSSAKRAQSDDEFRLKVLNFLKNADVGIADLQIEESSVETPDVPSDAPEEVRQFFESLNKLTKGRSRNRIDIKTLHKIGNTNRMIAFDLEEDESFGTQRFFALCNPIISSLEEGHLLVVDELDCSLHPKLTRKIVELFLSEEYNPQGAQLVFVSHDSSLFDSKLFRRDQLRLVEKNESGASEFSSLAEFEHQPRKNEALEKRYLEGRYGGVPNFGVDFDGLVVE